MNKSKEKTLYFDIETSHCLAYVWGCGKQYVGANQIKKDRKIISICYMFEGDKQVSVLKMNMKKHKINQFDDDADREMLVKFSKVYLQADMAIAHNGRRFDVARIRARLVKYGLPDISSTLFMDSYTMCKNIDFTSHKLDFLGKYLSTGQKDKVDLNLWIRVMEGDAQALDQMCRYNATDVKRLRSAYLKLKPYCKSTLNLAVVRNDMNICPSCGGKLIKDGFRYRLLRQVQQFQCQACKKKCTNGVNMLSTKQKLFPR